MSHVIEEIYDVYDETQRKAAKDHGCNACSETIRRGDLYTSVSIIFEGAATRIKRCVRCQRLHEHLRGLAEGETWPDERLNCGESYEEDWGPAPESVQALAFMTADEAQALTFDGVSVRRARVSRDGET